MIELLVVIATVVALSFILFPAAGRAKQRAQRIRCTSNLKQIGLAFKTRALDRYDRFPAQALTNKAGMLEPEAQTNVAVHFLVMSNELSTPRILLCPVDVGRISATDFHRLQSSNISYFVNLDAAESTPLIPLSGDRNVTNGLPVTNHILYLAMNRATGWTHELHNSKGQIGLADGSVEQFGDDRLNEWITIAGANSRLLMP